MTRTWKLEQAKSHFSELIRAAETEPQVITRHGKPVAVVHALPEEAKSAAATQAHSALEPRTALDALRGDFDFSDFPDEDLFARDSSSDLRDLDL